MAKFFQAWDTIPPWSTRPADAALEQRIAKLAEFAAKNGPPFVEMMREKQANNPEYSFLSGGVGSDYFRWRLYCGLYNLDAGSTTGSCCMSRLLPALWHAFYCNIAFE